MLTAETPIPIRTPRERINHHNAAPANPAPPVPLAKYLNGGMHD